ncbi:MAG: Holliday junction ATP-dependent DNA helicase RuvA [Desulfovibrionaceae bacterium]|nr:Holliday junction ATP-dependent DNA helicase RuvA [Desulfovibrionaceae bacterium]
MIAYLEGTLLAATDKAMIVLTKGGVGYEVFASTPVLASLPAKGGELAVYVHTRVLEGGLELYGFGTLDELNFFRTLISIEKLGPKKALAILSRFNPGDLREIAWREDAAALASVPGIGPKSSRQILWFLKEKVHGPAGPETGRPPTEGGAQGEFMDALAGLANLGYSDDEVRPLLREVMEPEPDLDAASAIRMVLKKIAAARK